MRDEKEERKKQARSTNKQGKATQHTQGSHVHVHVYLYTYMNNVHIILYTHETVLSRTYMSVIAYIYTVAVVVQVYTVVEITDMYA